MACSRSPSEDIQLPVCSLQGQRSYNPAICGIEGSNHLLILRRQALRSSNSTLENRASKRRVIVSNGLQHIRKEPPGGAPCHFVGDEPAQMGYAYASLRDMEAMLMPGFSTGRRQLINDQRQTSAFAVSSSKVWAMWVGWLLVSLAFLFSPAAVQAQGQYTASALYNFCPQSGCPDGGNPTSPPVFDTHGNIYGVANVGGANHQGVVYRADPERRHVERKCSLQFLFAIRLCRRQRPVLSL